ncbi:FAD-dependent oxidoreductase [Nocardia arthritidis]|uniref:FAD-dependent monooxygenase n=1 Tax=Nocardia arthritidis TaxID=228602 RepID=A0A6G9Y8L3_9NOCA|nr:NAD(P)/FAD-dependent oxidoreductase [Nocardia arthritidis]QIS09460.1 FAD-dependent monooxygenase [Nocardia arthritidis]
MSKTRSAIVIGGGIAGPVTATALHKAGIEARIYESYPHESLGVGGGLGLAANGIAALDVIGAGEAFRAVSEPARRQFMVLGGKQIELPPVDGIEPLRSVTRSDLYRVLHERAADAGVPIEYGKRIEGVEEHDARVTAHFTDGSTATADVLIGADGIHSTVRTLIDPQAPGPNYTGMLAFGAAVDVDVDVEPESMYFVFGKKAYYLYWSTADGKIVWAVNLPHREYLTLAQANAKPAEHWLRLIREFYGDDTPGGEFARATTAENLITIGGLHIMPSVPHWYRGRMALVGDAVHAPSNSTGQGASLAIESAVQLARCLRDLPDAASAFAAYERLRRGRVEKIAARGAQVNHQKTMGPIARMVMPKVMPIMMRMASVQKVTRDEQNYRIDWDAPVQRELAA